MKIPRILISGTNSGCGKTTIVSAVLGGLIKKGYAVQGYKCGPDYIDGMFHSFITKRRACNLDSFMCEDNAVKYLMADRFDGADIAIIEGVMGFYDGIGKTDVASTYDIAKITNTPTILVVNAKGMALSLSALISGFINFRENNNIKGVILNGIKAGMVEYYRDILKDTGIEVLGYMPFIDDVEIKSRHLGLHMADEIEDLDCKIDKLSDVAIGSINFDRIIEIAKGASEIDYTPIKVDKVGGFRLGVAMDSAFCFYYEDNLRLLERFGAEIIPISPLSDEQIVDNLDGIYIGGGYPELYLNELSKNKMFINGLRKMINDNAPIYAECGGFMYLLNSIFGIDGREYEMVGAINASASLTDKLCRFGYIQLTSMKDNMLAKIDEKINGHEFHYSDSTNNGDAFLVQRPNGKTWRAVHATDNIVAGYPHIHFYSNINIARNFANKCVEYKKGKSNF